MSGKNRQKKESPQLGRKNGRAKGNAPRQEGGQSKRDHATAYGQRSGVTTGDRKVRRMREHARLGARRERDVTDSSHSFQKWVLEERTVLWNS